MRSVKSFLTRDHYNILECIYNKIHLYHTMTHWLAEGNEEIKIDYIDIEALRGSLNGMKESLESMLDGCTVQSDGNLKEQRDA